MTMTARRLEPGAGSTAAGAAGVEGSTMGKRSAGRAAAWIGVGLAALVLVVNRPLLVHRWSHWVARHRGEGANLAGMNLDSMDLSRASLKKANLRGACLRNTRCFDTNFRGADLRKADLRYALLAGADLRWAQLSGARFSNAIYDRSTRWPKGFNPGKHGALKPEWDAKLWSVFGRPQR
jgi:hypothetical protein